MHRLLTIALLLLCLCHATASEYQVQGRLIYEGFTGTNVPVSTFHRDFSVLVSPTNWIIKSVSHSEEAARSGVQYNIAALHDSNVFGITKVNSGDPIVSASNLLQALDSDLDKLRAASRDGKDSPEFKTLNTRRTHLLRQIDLHKKNHPVSRNDAVGVVLEGTVPEFDEGIIPPLWFSLVSHSFSNGLLPAVWTPRAPQSAEVKYMSARYATNGGPPGLISTAAFFSGPGLDSANQVASYAAEDWQTSEGLTFPARFFMTAFARGNSNRVDVRISATVTSVLVAATIERPMQDYTNIVFRDERFRSDVLLRQPLTYAAAGPATMAEAVAKPEYHRATKQVERMTPKKASRAVIGSMVGLFVIAPVLFMFLNRRKRAAGEFPATKTTK